MLSKRILKNPIITQRNLTSLSYYSFSKENKDGTDPSQEQKPHFSNTYRFFNFINPANQDWGKLTFWKKPYEKPFDPDADKKKWRRKRENYIALTFIILYVVMEPVRDEFMLPF